MILFPAIDLYEGEAVRLLRGDYRQKTVYSHNPCEIAEDFRRSGAEAVHLVDLEGAKNGDTPNFDTVLAIKRTCGLFCEIGGGIRSVDTVKKYLDAGIDRVILGTAAVTDPDFLREAVGRWGDRIAVGVDIRDGDVSIRGWTESSGCNAFAFCEMLQKLGVSTVICTDISKDGAMQGTNRELYRELSERFSLRVTASGGVSSMEDIRALRALNLYGAIIGKAYYTGDLKLREALEAAR